MYSATFLSAPHSQWCNMSFVVLFRLCNHAAAVYTYMYFVYTAECNIAPAIDGGTGFVFFWIPVTFIRRVLI